MTDEEAHAAFGDPVGRQRRRAVLPEVRLRRALQLPAPPLWKCKACTHQFCVTSGTIFASRKLPIRDYPAGHRDLRERREGP